MRSTDWTSALTRGFLDPQLPDYLGTELLNRAPKIESKVYIKKTNTGLLLLFQSHVDIKYMRSLVNTMVVALIDYLLTGYFSRRNVTASEWFFIN